MKKFYEDLGAEEGGLAQKARVLSSKLNQRLQVLLDKSTPKPVERWLALAALVFIYFVRVSRRRPGPGPDPSRLCPSPWTDPFPPIVPPTRSSSARSTDRKPPPRPGFRAPGLLHRDLRAGNLQPEPADRVHLAANRPGDRGPRPAHQERPGVQALCQEAPRVQVLVSPSLPLAASSLALTRTPDPSFRPCSQACGHQVSPDWVHHDLLPHV